MRAVTLTEFVSTMIAISDNVQIRTDKPSGSIIINRPNRRNALSKEMLATIHQGFEDLYQENQVRAVILTGTGSTFCSGTDLYELRELIESPDAEKRMQDDLDVLQSLIEYMLRYPKPIVCGVNGCIAGSGLALMLASDIVIADQGAAVLFPEADRGLFSGLAAALLAFRIGAGSAVRLMLSSKEVVSSEACRLGLFHELVAGDLVWARCQQFITEIAGGARQSQQLIKQMFNETVGEELFTQLRIGAAQTAAARTTDAAKEGICAFLEKRPTEW
jgi:enoyl-CoA hydratase/carnithine racemase